MHNICTCLWGTVWYSVYVHNALWQIGVARV
jgi:hypothetical protein